MVRKIEAEFDLQTGTAIEADFEVTAVIPVSQVEHNDLSGRDATDAHPMSAITGLTAKFEADEKTVSDHIADTDNPHSVTKTQVGLGNVPNTDTTNASNISSGTLSNDRLGTIPYSKLSGVQATITSTNKLSSDLVDDTNKTHRFVSTSDITNWNGKVTANTAITGATKTKITYDSKGLVTSGDNLSASDIPNLTLSKITDVTATASELNVLDGITATTTELNYVDGVTSNIQTQLNGKQATLPTLESGKFLTNNGTNLSWSTVDALPSQSGNSGKQLTTDGSTASWSNTILVRDWGD